MRKRAERSCSVYIRVPDSVRKAAEKAALEDQRSLSSLILLEANNYLEPRSE